MDKILIVEDHRMLRESLEKLINEQKDMEVSGSTDDAANSLDLCRKLKPHLVLMDVVTKNDNSGILFTSKLLKEFPALKVVIMTAYPEITFAEEARKAGAHSFFYKEMGNDNLLNVIRNTMKGFSIYSTPSNLMPFSFQFTEIEIAIIRLVCQGVDRSEIEEKLGISGAMLRKHITAILDKTGFESISKFGMYAVSKGLILPVPSGESS
jgi:DNA-binding NarL/FixJ family response regulator